jgi:hypothetical protein
MVQGFLSKVGSYSAGQGIPFFMGLKWAGHVALIEDTKKYIQSLSRKT